mmetsp:Transcript_8652/g.19287  ORF Transcript_8652/g.19287 Transcript_8652/m.19287 type:complete len:138 (+) Transcript_8652:2-415(+)
MVASKLALLQEVPWWLACSVREEILSEAVAQASRESSYLQSAAERAMKVQPLQVAYTLMCSASGSGDPAGVARKWLDECSRHFGQDSDHAQRVKQVVAELQTQLPCIPEASMSRSQSKALQQLLRSVLACTSIQRKS